MLWAEVRAGALADAVRAGRLSPVEAGASGFTGTARQDQWYAARQTLKSGLVRLGIVPDVPGGHRRIGLAQPAAVRLVTWDGVPVRPAVQFSVAHTAERVVVALRRTATEAGVGPAGLGVDLETEWSTAERNLHRFGTEAELRLLRRSCGSALPLHLWCAKEALAKACGRGFRVPPRRYRLGPGDGTPHLLTVDIDERGSPAAGPRPVRIRIGTRAIASRVPAAWAVADLPSRWTPDQGSEHS